MRVTLPALVFLAALAPQGLHAEPPSSSAPAKDADAVYDSDASLAAHADDIVDYTLRATLDADKHTVHGDGTIRWRNAASVPVRELWVHLYLNALKNEGSLFLREPVGAARGTGPLADWGYIDVRRFALRGTDGTTDLWANAELHRPGDGDETDVRVPLPREVAAGESITLEMTWDSKLPNVVERTGYLGAFHMVAQWFPKIARLEPSGRWAHFPFHHLAEFYADFGTYDVTLDVPASFVVGATGPALESQVAGGRRVERHVISDVHDFAWTAWDQWQVLRESIDGVVVSVLYPPGFKVDALRELATIRFALPHYRTEYGRYPYPVLTLVHPPERAAEAGGMEYPTLITTGGPWYGPSGVFVPEILTIHEFGHQYFYGLIASDEVSWPFLDEGLDSYAETEAMAAWRGPANAVDLAGLRVSLAEAHAIQARDFEHDAPVAQPAFAFPTGSDYGHLVYSRTATILQTLRRVYGSALFSKAMGRYARKWRFLHPSPDDFVATIEEVVGTPAATALRTALFDKGWVDYAVTGVFSHRVSPAAGVFDRDGKRVTVAAATGDEGDFEGWALVTRRGTLSFPVDVALTLEDGTVETLRWDGAGEFARLPYHGASALRAAVVDPNHDVLLDDNLINNRASAAASPSAGAPRTLERATYWAELLVQAMSP
jgi:hypothetical protein